MRRWPVVVASAFLLVACAGGDETSEGGSEDEIAKRARRYVDVSAEAPMTGVPRDKILRALARIERVSREATDPMRRALAAETLARIEGGDVLLGSIEASRGIDRWHMCKDEKERACEGAMPSPDDRTWRGDAALARKLESDLAGYQWGNRIYFTLSSATDVNELAATLVHEVDHVAHRSECSYYRVIDDHVVEPDLAYVEEFRAFLAECFFGEDAPTLAKCSAYAAGRVSDYGFDAKLSRVLPNRSDDPAKLAELIVAAEPDGAARFGRLVPRKRDWPASFGTCRAR
ncbi:MAG: hypothetical protein JST00_25795 [Deltaproteobacteria bacterium]|nr:hypothetical protein [Deltaproteobacteria bacterium]